MGQQQILLIVLGMIVVGIAIAISMQLFRQAAIDNKRDMVINECSNLASLAISYYKKPEPFGGGKSFTNWNIPITMQSTVNGTYEATMFSDSIIIIGTGTEVVTGTDSIKVRTTVTANSYSTVIIN